MSCAAAVACKEMPIATGFLIKKMALPAGVPGFNLQLSGSSGHPPELNPRVKLEAITCFQRTVRRLLSPFAKPDGMGI